MTASSGLAVSVKMLATLALLPQPPPQWLPPVTYTTPLAIDGAEEAALLSDQSTDPVLALRAVRVWLSPFPVKYTVPLDTATGPYPNCPA